MQHCGAILNMELVVVSVISVCKIQQQQQQQWNRPNEHRVYYGVLQLYVNGDRVTIHRRSAEQKKNVPISNCTRTTMCRRIM